MLTQQLYTDVGLYIIYRMVLDSIEIIFTTLQIFIDIERIGMKVIEICQTNEARKQLFPIFYWPQTDV